MPWKVRDKLFLDLKRRIFKADIELLVLQMIAGHILSYHVTTVMVGKRAVLSVQVSPIVTQLAESADTTLCRTQIVK